ncbi:MAG: glycosyltransferase family 4 protein [Saprospiraceae bacterium]
MRVLQLCKKFPYPTKDGESIAMTTLSRALNELGCEVTLLAMNTSKHYFDLKQLPKDFNHYQEIHTAAVDNRIKPFAAFKNLFSSESYHIQRFVSEDFSNELRKLLQRKTFDVVQLETLYLAPYIPIIRQYSKAIVALRSHNVEHEIWERIAVNTRFLPKKWYLQHLTKKLKRYEVAQLQNYDLLVSITERDQKIYQQLGYQKATHVTPVGIDSRYYLADDASFKDHISIGFIGSLDWMPNQEGLKWFLQHVWQRIRTQFPDLQLHIAGRNTPKWLLNSKEKNVVVHGEVPDAAEFINQHSLMVVPLLSGSGMRVKILEGMALGRVVLTTEIGLEGIEAEHASEVMIANQPEEFVNCVAECYQSNGQLVNLGRRAQVLVAKEYDNLEIGQRLITAYQQMLPQQKSNKRNPPSSKFSSSSALGSR